MPSRLASSITTRVTAGRGYSAVRATGDHRAIDEWSAHGRHPGTWENAACGVVFTNPKKGKTILADSMSGYGQHWFPLPVHSFLFFSLWGGEALTWRRHHGDRHVLRVREFGQRFDALLSLDLLLSGIDRRHCLFPPEVRTQHLQHEHVRRRRRRRGGTRRTYRNVKQDNDADVSRTRNDDHHGAMPRPGTTEWRVIPNSPAEDDFFERMPSISIRAGTNDVELARVASVANKQEQPLSVNLRKSPRYILPMDGR